MIKEINMSHNYKLKNCPKCGGRTTLSSNRIDDVICSRCLRGWCREERRNRHNNIITTYWVSSDSASTEYPEKDAILIADDAEKMHRLYSKTPEETRIIEQQRQERIRQEMEKYPESPDSIFLSDFSDSLDDFIQKWIEDTKIRNIDAIDVKGIIAFICQNTGEKMWTDTFKLENTEDC